ncbi:DUF5776 domain-containing protein [Levilactobacillus tujiorum]|uniref:BspA family leucine-rich repeat surface protein n=1 Tax=Levilactobacillus tujiorum TaxID=2912243 RepID=A0ABX1L4C4_9LACO|nr:DUF5776 domain-containing protein [Levilactobacillus tujiorum]MCH5464842.1 DUF5776 domain-containing protein [Levilactobacillus tujiorum]NLR11860.1 BspA family leucine-rich repeat surface protein [Lactobacillus sp. HBUAS51387]NLR29878.1 BspA family leucine-rich repeat surface protein [Levilactobacillus tujiorum]
MMKRGVVSFALTAALVVGGVTALENSPQIANWAPTVVAHADDSSSVVAQKTTDTWSWKLTADGVLHIGKGTQGAVLPESTNIETNPNWPTNWRSPFQSIQLEETSTDIKVISFDDKMQTPRNSAALFKLFTINDKSDDYPQFRNWQNIDTSQTENFSEMFMSSGQKNIDVSHFDTSNATTMEEMFDGVTAKVVGYENFNTSKVTNFQSMFARFGDDPNGTIDLSHYQVSQVKGTDIDDYGDTVDLYNFDGMLGGVTAKSINIGKWQPNAPLTGIFRGSSSTNVTQLTLSPQDNLTDSELLGADISNGADLKKYTGNWENIKDQYVAGKKTTYKTPDLIAKYNGDSGDAGDETYIWEPVVTPGKPITVNYVDQDNPQQILKTVQLQGGLGTAYTVTPANISGYQFVKVLDGSLKGTYTADPQTVTLAYKKQAPVTPGTNTASSATSSASTSSSAVSSSESDQVKPKLPANKDLAITAVKKLGLYRTPNFSQKTRQFYYTKQTRTKRPQFVITGVAQSKNGTKRYLVRDVTPNSKRYGKTGYITARKAFTVHTYYQATPKTVKVIAAKGVDAYRHLNLKGNAKHYKRGMVLHVKKLARYHLTTRLQLTNGRYVTSNKTLIIQK